MRRTLVLLVEPDIGILVDEAAKRVKDDRLGRVDNVLRCMYCAEWEGQDASAVIRIAEQMGTARRAHYWTC